VDITSDNGGSNIVVGLCLVLCLLRTTSVDLLVSVAGIALDDRGISGREAHSPQFTRSPSSRSLVKHLSSASVSHWTL